MAGSAFLGHGPGMRVAVALLFSSAAAEFLAGVLVILAASRLAKLASESAAPGKAPGWKRRLLPAILLSVCSFFLMFVLGEFLESQVRVRGGRASGHRDPHRRDRRVLPARVVLPPAPSAPLAAEPLGPAGLERRAAAHWCPSCWSSNATGRPCCRCWGSRSSRSRVRPPVSAWRTGSPGCTAIRTRVPDKPHGRTVSPMTDHERLKEIFTHALSIRVPGAAERLPRGRVPR